MLLSLVLLSGCSATRAVIADATALCEDWRHQTVSKKDVLTDDTAAGIEASNKSRPNWGCEYGKDEVKR